MTGPADTRLWSRLFALGRIGARVPGNPAAGVDRQALSAAEGDAWELLIGWGAEAGLTPATDAAGNLFLTLPGTDPSLPPVLAGSHIDSQPTGGLFDGAFGTLAALEAATVLAAEGPHPRALRVVAWMNEEGSRFAPGMMGSALFAGARDLDSVRGVTDAEGISVGEALDTQHARFAHLPRLPLGFPVAACLEPHIEQGPRLEAAGRPIGVVSGIQGKITWEVSITGREAHAGTEEMTARADALQAFVRCATALQARVGLHDPQVRFTIGRLELLPNAPSVVPASCVFRIDLRHPEAAVLNALGALTETLILQEAPPCEVTLRRLVEDPPNAFDPALRRAIAGAADRLGHGAMEMLSAAGHDARYLARVAPTAMIFIPCRGGVSHHPDEWAEPAHVRAGSEVLTEVLRPLLR